MALSLEAIHRLKPKAWLRHLESEARSQLLDEGARLVAWQRTTEAIAQLEAMLKRVGPAAEGAERRRDQAASVVSEAKAKLGEAVEALRRAERAKREVRYAAQEPIQVGSLYDPYVRGPMARGGAAPHVREEGPSIAALERRVKDAQRQVWQAEREQERAETAWRGAEERASACRRFLEALRDRERPETPTLDLLWSLMRGGKEGDI